MKNFHKNNVRKVFLNRHGMTLPELLVAVFILVLAVTGIILSYLQAMELQEVAQATSVATKAALSRIDQIRSTTYNQIKTTYNGVAFNVTGLNAKGVSYVNDDNPKLLLVKVEVSWKQRSNRVYGDDKNLNGQADAGEHVDAKGMMDSPVQLTSWIFEK